MAATSGLKRRIRPRAGLLVGVMVALASAGAALAFGGKPEHSTVESKVESGPADSLTLRFQVKPDSGMAINLEGPWKLELKSHPGLKFGKSTLARADLDEKLPGFVITTAARPEQTGGKLDYSLTAFICTSDKTQCYREVHAGTLDWQTPAGNAKP